MILIYDQRRENAIQHRPLIYFIISIFEIKLKDTAPVQNEYILKKIENKI